MQTKIKKHSALGLFSVWIKIQQTSVDPKTINILMHL